MFCLICCVAIHLWLGEDASAEASPSKVTPTQITSTTEEASQEVDILPSDALPSDALASSADDSQMNALTGVSLNGDLVSDKRIEVADSFYYEPLADPLREYITGISYPADAAPSSLAVTYEDLCYVHVLHYDFQGKISQGELICNKAIASDLTEIFYELYLHEYPIEKIRLIDEYAGDDTASMEDNNTSCFNYRTVAGSTSLSKHSLGLAIDINPLYNPYVTYNQDGSANIAPVSGTPYADRTSDFLYKITENDICWQLFTDHGFTWGGSWNSVKDYQHFQKYPVK